MKAAWLNAQDVRYKCLKQFLTFFERLRPESNSRSFFKIPVFKPNQVLNCALRESDAAAGAGCALPAHNCTLRNIKIDLLGRDFLQVVTAARALSQIGAMS